MRHSLRAVVLRPRSFHFLPGSSLVPERNVYLLITIEGCSWRLNPLSRGVIGRCSWSRCGSRGRRDGRPHRRQYRHHRRTPRRGRRDGPVLRGRRSGRSRRSAAAAPRPGPLCSRCSYDTANASAIRATLSCATTNPSGAQPTALKGRSGSRLQCTGCLRSCFVAWQSHSRDEFGPVGWPRPSSRDVTVHDRGWDDVRSGGCRKPSPR